RPASGSGLPGGLVAPGSAPGAVWKDARSVTCWGGRVTTRNAGRFFVLRTREGGAPAWDAFQVRLTNEQRRKSRSSVRRRSTGWGRIASGGTPATKPRSGWARATVVLWTSRVVSVGGGVSLRRESFAMVTLGRLLSGQSPC